MEALGKGVKGATKKAVKGITKTGKVAAKTGKYAVSGVKKTGKMTGLIGNKKSKDKNIEDDDFMDGEEEEVEGEEGEQTFVVLAHHVARPARAVVEDGL